MTSSQRITLLLTEYGFPPLPPPRCWFEGCAYLATNRLAVTNDAGSGCAVAPVCREHCEVLQLEAAVDMDFSRLTIEWERERITLAPRA